jgi:hypothetical protein
VSQQTYTLSRDEIEALLLRFAQMVAEREGIDRATIWTTMFGPRVLAQVGLKQ